MKKFDQLTKIISGDADNLNNIIKHFIGPNGETTQRTYETDSDKVLKTVSQDIQTGIVKAFNPDTNKTKNRAELVKSVQNSIHKEISYTSLGYEIIGHEKEWHVDIKEKLKALHANLAEEICANTYDKAVAIIEDLKTQPDVKIESTASIKGANLRSRMQLDTARN